LFASRAARFRRADFGFLSEGMSPGERVRPVTAATEMLQAAENVALFGQSRLIGGCLHEKIKFFYKSS